MASGKNSVTGIAAGVLTAQLAPKMLRKTRKLAFRWRRALTPLWFGGFIWATSVILRWQAQAWWPTVLVLPVVGLGLAWFGPKLSERWARVVMAVVPAGLDRGRDGVLDRPVERVYFASLMTYIGVYMAVRVSAGPSEFSGWMWMIGVGLWGGTWWYHRRVRVAGRADKFAKKWPQLADPDSKYFRLSPLHGSKVVRAVAEGRTSVLTVELAASQTADAVAHLTGALASFFNLRKGSVFVSDTAERARQVVITFLPKDPWRGDLAHPLPEPGSISLALTHKRFQMGLLANGTPLIYQLQHTLVVGATGSGKSGWLHSLMIWLTACTDCVVVGIDMAAGATLGMWRQALALPLATDVEQAIVVLEGVFRTVQDREIQLGLQSEDDDDAADAFEPTDQCPWLVLVIEEFPDLLADAKMTTRYDENGKPNGTYEKLVLLLMGRIAKKARKCGVRIILASQNGTKLDLGSKEMQAQLRAIVGLSLDAQQSKNLWGQLQYQGWKSTDLTVGQFLLKDDEHIDARISKGFWTSDKARRAQAKKAAALCQTKFLEPSAHAALTGVSGNGDYIDGEVIPTQRGPEDEMYDLLVNEGPHKAVDLERLLKASQASVYRWKDKLVERGLIDVSKPLWCAVEAVSVTEAVPGTKISSIQGEQMP